jgi:hypothetical protein
MKQTYEDLSHSNFAHFKNTDNTPNEHYQGINIFYFIHSYGPNYAYGLQIRTLLEKES